MQVCTKLCEAPGQVMVQGVLCGSDTLQLSQALLEAAVKSLARDRRALDRDVAAYCEEAGVLGEGGRSDLAIKYIGRALEVAFPFVHSQYRCSCRSSPRGREM
jgi:hypothetical protein